MLGVTQPTASDAIAALVAKADECFGIPMPGNTHLQHAQPILFSHFLLAHAEGFFHDLDRLAFSANTANACPMGSGALAGCSFPVDRMAVAKELGFARITRNSLDSVSRRDFALDYLYALAVLAQHLSRLAEDFVLFASQEFGFVTLSDALIPSRAPPSFETAMKSTMFSRPVIACSRSSGSGHAPKCAAARIATSGSAPRYFTA